MSLLKGALSVARFSVLGHVPEESLRSWLQTQLEGRAFREPIGIQRSEQISGWVLASNLLDTDFSGDGWMFNHYVVLSLRVDRKVLPTRTVKAMLEKRMRAWCQEHSRERAPASVRTEIRELLEDELYARTMARSTTIDIWWNLVDGYVVTSNASEAGKDLLRKTFRDTFGLVLAPQSPVDFVGDLPDVTAALEITGPMDVKMGPYQTSLPGSHRGQSLLSEADLEALRRAGGGAPSSAERPTLPHLAADFYAWLWWLSEREEGRVDLGQDGGVVDIWVDSRVSFRSQEGKARSTMSGENAGAMTEARAALATGRTIQELGIGMRREGREYEGTLKGPHLDLVGLRLPTEIKGKDGADEVVYERTFLYEDFQFVVAMLFRRFAAERVAAMWAVEGLLSMRAWVAVVFRSADDEAPHEADDEGEGYAGAFAQAAPNRGAKEPAGQDEVGSPYSRAALVALAERADELSRAEGAPPDQIDRFEGVSRSLRDMARPIVRGQDRELTADQQGAVRNWRTLIEGAESRA